MRILRSDGGSGPWNQEALLLDLLFLRTDVYILHSRLVLGTFLLAIE